MKRANRTTFVVPALAGDYAPEEVYFSLTGDNAALDFVGAYQTLIESLPTDAVIEVEMLRLGDDVDQTDDADWFLLDSFDDAGFWTNEGLLGWRLRMRAKSGGTTGNAIVSTHWKGTE